MNSYQGRRPTRTQTISLKEARHVVLTAQGLARPNQFGAGLNGAQ